MIRQQPLFHDRRVAGFWAAVRIGATVEIDDTAWKAALEKGDLVGTCRECGHYLRPGESYRIGRVTWYPAACSRTGCTYQTAGHGKRPEPAKKKDGGHR